MMTAGEEKWAQACVSGEVSYLKDLLVILIHRLVVLTHWSNSSLPTQETISSLENSNINSLAAVKENDKF